MLLLIFAGQWSAVDARSLAIVVIASEAHTISHSTELRAAMREEVPGGMILVMNQSLKMTCRYSRFKRCKLKIIRHLKEIKQKKSGQDITKVKPLKVDLNKDLYIEWLKQKVSQMSLSKNLPCSLSMEVSVLIISDGLVACDQDFITTLA